MTSRITAKQGRQFPLLSRWFAKRKRAAGVLLSGWFFFSIIGMVPPCCVAFAGTSNDHVMTQMMSAAEMQLAGMPASTSQRDDQCPLAFTADSALPSQLYILPATIGHTPSLVVVSYSAPLFAIAVSSQSFDLYHPSPPPRIYIRTQRLLI